MIPLAIYLATFVAVFRERPWFDHAAVVRLAPIVVAPVAVTLLGVINPYWLAAIGFNLLAFAVLALVCHGELYRRRPAAAHLTEFYLWISVGGAIGGAFAGLIAPYVFSNIYEYPILIAAALLALPGAFAAERPASSAPPARSSRPRRRSRSRAWRSAARCRTTPTSSASS